MLPSPGVGLQTGRGCSHFGCKTWASATPFGSWIFMAGLPSDERQIIHPHSNLDLGLSQVLGSIFPDTAAFSLHEGFDGSAGNTFKPGQLCPVLPFSHWNALSSSGAWSRQGMGQREAAVLWVTTWHRQDLAGGCWQHVGSQMTQGDGCVTGSHLARGSFLLSQCGKTIRHRAPVLWGCSAT